jgi:hypothetical protein
LKDRERGRGKRYVLSAALPQRVSV